jgi:hypothetical protein
LGFCEAVGIKAYGHERHTLPHGRRGKPIKKMRFMPAERAHALARKLQEQLGITVSVLGGLGPCRPHGRYASFYVLTNSRR